MSVKKIKTGKKYLEIEDMNGWKTRVNIRKSDKCIEIKQFNGEEMRYICFWDEETDLILNKIEEVLKECKRMNNQQTKINRNGFIKDTHPTAEHSSKGMLKTADFKLKPKPHGQVS